MTNSSVGHVPHNTVEGDYSVNAPFCVITLCEFGIVWSFNFSSFNVL